MRQAIVYVQTVFSRTVMASSVQTEIVSAFRHRRTALSDVELSRDRDGLPELNLQNQRTRAATDGRRAEQFHPDVGVVLLEQFDGI